MHISASVHNSYQQHAVTVATEANEKAIIIAPKAEGYGSSVNGGELLFLALATCFCNDLYREAAKRKMKIDKVDVTVSGEFGKEGEPANNIVYEVDIKSAAPVNEVEELIQYVDSIAEVHNTLRKGTAVTIKKA